MTLLINAVFVTAGVVAFWGGAALCRLTLDRWQEWVGLALISFSWTAIQLGLGLR